MNKKRLHELITGAGERTCEELEAAFDKQLLNNAYGEAGKFLYVTNKELESLQNTIVKELKKSKNNGFVLGLCVGVGGIIITSVVLAKIQDESEKERKKQFKDTVSNLKQS